MNLDFMSKVKQMVSDIVLEGNTDHLLEKNEAISKFLPILLAILKAKPNLIRDFQDQLNPRLSEVFGGNNLHKQEFLQSVTHQLPEAEMEQVLSQSIPATLGVLTQEAGSKDPTAIGHLLATNSGSIYQALPAGTTALLASLGIQKLHSEPHVSTTEPVQTYVPPEEEKKGGFLLPLIAFLILLGLCLFLFKACSQKESDAQISEATPVVNATQPATLQLSTSSTGDLVTCQILANNPSYMDILQNEVKQIFNHNIGCGASDSAQYAGEFIDQDSIPSVLKIVKGVPNINLVWKGDQLSIQGGTQQDVERVATQIRPLIKNMHILMQPQSAMPASTPVASDFDVNSTVDQSVTQAEQALAKINPEQVNALDIATALNLQIINFNTASAGIPEANKRILDQAAALMKRAPHVSLTVNGHTDAVGNAASNKNLSVERAQSVAQYLIDQGVNPNQLKVVGYGQERPIADNETAQGQFKNRRIEFEVINTETGVKRTVDEQGVNKKP